MLGGIPTAGIQKSLEGLVLFFFKCFVGLTSDLPASDVVYGFSVFICNGLLGDGMF